MNDDVIEVDEEIKNMAMEYWRTGEAIKNMAMEYWRESANSWLEIAAKQADPAVRLFACRFAEVSLDRMDSAKAES